MNIPRIFGTVSACVVSLVFIAGLKAEVIDAYFGMNYVEGIAPVPEVMLLDITYIGGGGGIHTTTMPAFSGLTPLGYPETGIPDGIGLVYQPTYSSSAIGDGDSTRVIGATVPIDWDVASLPFPSIRIISITVDAPTVGGIWKAAFTDHYTVGLIPKGYNDELYSYLPEPQGDIYGDIIGYPGNPVGRVIATSAPPTFAGLIGIAFGDFIFSAAESESTPAAESCNNGIDDNGDGLVDCADPQCEGFVGAPTSCGVGACLSTGNLVCQAGNVVDTCTPGNPGPEGPFGDVTCSDGIDNDCNGMVDAAESNCSATQEICDNSVDDNSDGLVDCADPQCDGSVDGACTTGMPGICAAGTLVCQNGGRVCSQNQPAGTEGPLKIATCSDGLDNDCDALTDEKDPDCTGDVFLTQLQVPNRLMLRIGQKHDQWITVRSKSTTATQNAKVDLKATISSINPSTNIKIAVQPGSVTQQITQGNPTQFRFAMHISCTSTGTGTVDWTATISAPVNDDRSNDILKDSTLVRCH